MKIAVLGTGMVGQTLAAAFAALGHEVMIGTRDVAQALSYSQPNAFGVAGFGEWIKDHPEIKVGTLTEAGAFSDLVVNAVKASTSIRALEAVGADNLCGKVLVDLGNVLDTSTGGPPRSLANDELGLAEQIQQRFPEARVVKTLNTMFAPVMVNPQLVPGESTVFLSGNDAGAKATVQELLKDFGWSDILDLGDISSARAVEMLMPLWLRNYSAIGSTAFNLKVVR